MNKRMAGMIALALVVGSAWADPVTVYDLGVSPDSPNKKVEVTYRLGEADAGIANVEVDISADGGATWDVPAETFYPGSDVGPGIPANGSLRRLVWDARADWNQQHSTQMVVRLNATATDQRGGLYFAAGDKIYRMNLDGSALTEVCAGFMKPEFLAVNPETGKLMIDLWASGTPVMAYDMARGGDATLLYNGPGYGGGQGMAYDPEAKILFLGLYYSGLYALDENDGEGWRCLASASDLAPTYGQRGQLDYDPAGRHVYFRSTYNGYCDECRWIWRVGYDGTGLTQIVRANGGDALAVDETNGVLYFSDLPGNATIKRANLDGTGVETIKTLEPPYEYCRFFLLDPTGTQLYVYLTSETSDYRNRAIARMNVDGTDFEILREVTGVVDGWGIALDVR